MDNESIKNLVMLELVAPFDPNKRIISEEEGKEVYSRYTEPRACTDAPRNWEYVFSAIKDLNTKQKMIKLYNHLDNTK